MQEKNNITNDVAVQNQPSSEFNHLPDSDTYIQKLERRLSRVKGTNKAPTSKDMISVLQQARDDYMSRLISSSAEQLSAFAPTEGDRELTISYVERKLFPEKNGVTYEEMQHLLESDVLAKVSAESNGDIGTEVDR
ncbi:hypothetical protein JTE90_004412 [Oedothorax gibbosus]|uniref:Uncharacterized protein n=1 Tax=Oedothorax gibbosus TaxID=931172 RepID=A0AAV6UQL1_9ARAC|nr:hypothetical protein JTE90_004412 [Oedothorax gibbosus]